MMVTTEEQLIEKLADETEFDVDEVRDLVHVVRQAWRFEQTRAMAESARAQARRRWGA